MHPSSNTNSFYEKRRNVSYLSTSSLGVASTMESRVSGSPFLKSFDTFIPDSLMAIEESSLECSENQASQSDLNEFEIYHNIPRRKAMITHYRSAKISINPESKSNFAQNPPSRSSIIRRSEAKRRNSAEAVAKASFLNSKTAEYYAWNPRKIRFSAPSIFYFQATVLSSNETQSQEQKDQTESNEKSNESSSEKPTHLKSNALHKSYDPVATLKPPDKAPLYSTQLPAVREKMVILNSESENRYGIYSQRIRPLRKEKTRLDQYMSKSFRLAENQTLGISESLLDNNRKSMYLPETNISRQLSKGIRKNATKMVLCINNTELSNMDPKLYIASVASESLQEAIFDRNSKAEIISDEPFIILKKTRDNADVSKTKIRAIDLQKLIDLMCKYIPATDHKDEEDHRMRIKIMKTFFITHDMCVSAVELLKEVAKRLFIALPTAMSVSERKYYRNTFLKPLQFQILDVFAHWKKARPDDFRPHGLLAELFTALYEYASDILIENNKLGFELLLPDRNILLDSNMLHSQQKSTFPNQSETKIPKIFLGNANSLTLDEGTVVEIFLSFSTDMMANQMTQIDLGYLSNVRVCDLPHNLKNRRPNSNNRFHRMIEYTNYLTFFWVHTILGTNEGNKKKIVAWLLETAEKLLFLNNFQSFSIIMGALTNVALMPWMQKEIDPRSLAWARFSIYEELYMDVAQFRKKINNASCPKIPSIMIVSEDITKLVAVYEISTPLETRKLIDFQVMEEIAEMIDNLLNPQNHSYNPIESNTRIQDLLVNEPKRVMRKLDPDMNISQIQTKLMSKNPKKKKSFFGSVFS